MVCETQSLELAGALMRDIADYTKELKEIRKENEIIFKLLETNTGIISLLAANISHIQNLLLNGAELPPPGTNEAEENEEGLGGMYG